MNFRPRLEALDERVVPAADTWLGGLYTDPASWSLGHTPNSTDSVLCDGSVSNAPLAVPDGVNLSITSLQLINGYSGAVSFGSGGSLTVDGTLDVGSGSVTANSPITVNSISLSGGTMTTYGTATAASVSVVAGALALYNSLGASSLSLGGGTIDQGPTASDITVTSSFNWTSGTLNSTANLANVILNGAIGTIWYVPMGGGPMNLGSNISLVNSAQLTLKEATVNLLNDGIEFNIYQNCSLLVDPGAGKQANVMFSALTIKGNPNKVFEGGVVEVKSGFWNEPGSSLVNYSGGTFKMDAATRTYFGGKVPVFGNAQDSFWSAGTEYFATDASLEVKFQMHKTAGTIVMTCGSKTTANIVGDVLIENGDISYQAEYGNRRNWGEFWVDGNLTWNAGTYYPYVDADNSGDNADWLHVTQTIGLGNITISPTAIDSEGSIVTPPSNTEWRLFSAMVGMNAQNNTTQTLPQGWTFVKDTGNPNLWWDLKTN